MTEPATQTTLGQKIDALLEPMYEEAERHRGFIKLGQAKIAELESGLAESQSALAQIEERMVQVLRSLAAEEPVLATALGGGRLPGPAKQDTLTSVPTPPAVPTAAPTPIPTPASAPVAAATTPAAPKPTTTTPAPDAKPAARALAMTEPGLNQDSASPPIEPELDDATAMDEISAMLAAPPEQAGVTAPAQEPVKMEDAAARAAAAADKLLADAEGAPGQ